MSTCHVMHCKGDPVEISWCPKYGVVLQVCKEHLFDTLSKTATLDIRRAKKDHEENLEKYHRGMK